MFVGQLWKSTKYAQVYLRSYETVSQAREAIARTLDFYDGRRPHGALDAITPDAYCYQHLPAKQAAA